jgi:outer membrane protein OmpA-like peptidoglycan-associated protein
MHPRFVTLPASLLLLQLAGCANQPPAAIVDQNDLNLRLAAVETRVDASNQATSSQVGELGKKVEAMQGDLRQTRDTVAAQDTRLNQVETARAGVSGTLAEYVAKTDQHLNQLDSDNRANASLRAALDDATKQNQQRLAQLASRIETGGTQSDAARKVEAAAQNAQLQALSQRLEQLSSRVETGGNQSAAAHQVEATTLQQRLDQFEQRLASQSTTNAVDTATRNAQLQALGQRVESLDARSSLGLADQVKEHDADFTKLADRIDANDIRLNDLASQTGEVAMQTGDLVAALPALNAKTNADSDRLAAIEKRLSEAERMAQDAFDASGLGQRKIYGKVVESITLTEDRTLFPLNSPDLGDQDKAKLDALATRLKTLGTSYHLQIQGHTDGIGSDDYNFELGKARAEVVKNYLNNQCGIPVLRMSAISYGALEARNSATMGSNRRIVVQVLQ